MKSDYNSDLVILTYGTPKAHKEFEKEAKKVTGVREMRIYCLEIPLDNKNYNRVINWTKSFLSQQCQRLLDVFDKNFIGRFIIKQFEKRTGYTKIKAKWDWEKPHKHKLTYLNALPIAVQHHTAWACTTDEERVNMERVKRLESDGYKNPNTPQGLIKQGIYNQRWFDKRKNKKKRGLI